MSRRIIVLHEEIEHILERLDRIEEAVRIRQKVPEETFFDNVEAPIKLTTSGRGKLTTCFAGEDLVVQVCQG